MRLVIAKSPAVARNSKGRPESFAWPGGYPVFHITPHGDVLCPACAKERESHHAGDVPPAACEVPELSEVNWEDPDLYCEDCGERIESAYAEDDSETA